MAETNKKTNMGKTVDFYGYRDIYTSSGTRVVIYIHDSRLSTLSTILSVRMLHWRSMPRLG